MPIRSLKSRENSQILSYSAKVVELYEHVTQTQKEIARIIASEETNHQSESLISLKKELSSFFEKQQKQLILLRSELKGKDLDSLQIILDANDLALKNLVKDKALRKDTIDAIQVTSGRNQAYLEENSNPVSHQLLRAKAEIEEIQARVPLVNNTVILDNRSDSFVAISNVKQSEAEGDLKFLYSTSSQSGELLFKKDGSAFFIDSSGAKPVDYQLAKSLTEQLVAFNQKSQSQLKSKTESSSDKLPQVPEIKELLAKLAGRDLASKQQLLAKLMVNAVRNANSAVQEFLVGEEKYTNLNIIPSDIKDHVEISFKKNGQECKLSFSNQGVSLNSKQLSPAELDSLLNDFVIINAQAITVSGKNNVARFHGAQNFLKILGFEEQFLNRDHFNNQESEAYLGEWKQKYSAIEIEATVKLVAANLEYYKTLLELNDVEAQRPVVEDLKKAYQQLMQESTKYYMPNLQRVLLAINKISQQSDKGEQIESINRALKPINELLSNLKQKIPPIDQQASKVKSHELPNLEIENKFFRLIVEKLVSKDPKSFSLIANNLQRIFSHDLSSAKNLENFYSDIIVKLECDDRSRESLKKLFAIVTATLKESGGIHDIRDVEWMAEKVADNDQFKQFLANEKLFVPTIVDNVRSSIASLLAQGRQSEEAPPSLRSRTSSSDSLKSLTSKSVENVKAVADKVVDGLLQAKSVVADKVADSFAQAKLAVENIFVADFKEVEFVRFKSKNHTPDLFTTDTANHFHNFKYEEQGNELRFSTEENSEEFKKLSLLIKTDSIDEVKPENILALGINSLKEKLVQIHKDNPDKIEKIFAEIDQNSGLSLLEQAVIYIDDQDECIEALRFLLDNGAKIKIGDDLSRLTALQYAVAHNKTEVAKLLKDRLIESGQVDVFKIKDPLGRDVSHYAALNDNQEMAKLFENQVDKDSKDSASRTANMIFSEIPFKLFTIDLIAKLKSAKDLGDISKVQELRAEFEQRFEQEKHRIDNFKHYNNYSSKLESPAILKAFDDLIKIKDFNPKSSPKLIDKLITRLEKIVSPNKTINDFFNLCLDEPVDIDAIKKFIEKNKFDIDAFNHNGHTALHAACAKGNIELVKLLLTGSANPNAVGSHGDTALHFAAFGDNSSIAREISELLISQGAEINFQNKDGQSALHIAAAKNNYDLVKSLLARQEIIVATVDKDGDTPLLYAAWLPDLKILQLLFEREQECSTRTSKEAALYKVVGEGLLAATSFLLEKGANPNHAGCRTLTKAAQTGNMKIVELLYQKIDPANQNHQILMLFCLNSAINHGHNDVAAFFYEKTNDFTRDLFKRRFAEQNVGDDLKLKLLNFATIIQDSDLFELVSDLSGVKDKDGNDLLSRMIVESRPLAANFLLTKHKANVDANAVNKQGNQALHLALKDDIHGLLVTPILLEQEGIDLNHKNLRRETPLHIAARKGDFESVEAMLIPVEKDGLIVRDAANIKIRNHQGQTALDIALEKRDKGDISKDNNEVIYLLKAKKKEQDDQSFLGKVTNFFTAPFSNNSTLKAIAARVKKIVAKDRPNQETPASGSMEERQKFDNYFMNGSVSLHDSLLSIKEAQEYFKLSPDQRKKQFDVKNDYVPHPQAQFLQSLNSLSQFFHLYDKENQKKFYARVLGLKFEGEIPLISFVYDKTAGYDKLQMTYEGATKPVTIKDQKQLCDLFADFTVKFAQEFQQGAINRRFCDKQQQEFLALIKQLQPDIPDKGYNYCPQEARGSNWFENIHIKEINGDKITLEFTQTDRMHNRQKVKREITVTLGSDGQIEILASNNGGEQKPVTASDLFILNTNLQNIKSDIAKQKEIAEYKLYGDVAAYNLNAVFKCLDALENYNQLPQEKQRQIDEECTSKANTNHPKVSLVESLNLMASFFYMEEPKYHKKLCEALVVDDENPLRFSRDQDGFKVMFGGQEVKCENETALTQNFSKLVSDFQKEFKSEAFDKGFYQQKRSDLLAIVQGLQAIADIGQFAYHSDDPEGQRNHITNISITKELQEGNREILKIKFDHIDAAYNPEKVTKELAISMVGDKVSEVSYLDSKHQEAKEISVENLSMIIHDLITVKDKKKALDHERDQGGHPSPHPHANGVSHPVDTPPMELP